MTFSSIRYASISGLDPSNAGGSSAIEYHYGITNNLAVNNFLYVERITSHSSGGYLAAVVLRSDDKKMMIFVRLTVTDSPNFVLSGEETQFYVDASNNKQCFEVYLDESDPSILYSLVMLTGSGNKLMLIKVTGLGSSATLSGYELADVTSAGFMQMMQAGLFTKGFEDNL